MNQGPMSWASTLADPREYFDRSAHILNLEGCGTEPQSRHSARVPDPVAFSVCSRSRQVTMSVGRHGVSAAQIVWVLHRRHRHGVYVGIQLLPGGALMIDAVRWW